MRILNLAQGSPEWHDARAKHRNGSEAPAMMGAAKQISRSDLVRLYAAGTEREISDYVQNVVFARGHEVEALARPIAEEIIGETLYPATVVDDDDYLLSSLDGMTMGEDVLWECKQWNEELAASVRAGVCPDYNRWQCVQALKITGAARLLFMVTDGTRDKCVHMWITPDADEMNAMMAGWRQFDADVAAYVPRESTPEVIPAQVQGFGALVLQVEGRVVACNLEAFKVGAQAFLDRLPKANELRSDQDFADAEAAVKACKEAEERIEAAKAAAMSQAATIDEVFREVDHMAELIRVARLALDKNVKARKEQIRGDEIARGQKALREHIEAANHRLGKPYMPNIHADFAGAIKGLKKLDTMADAIDAELATAKIAATEAENRILRNLTTLRTEAADFAFLFADTAQIVLKEPDDLAALVKVRIDEHKAAVAAKAAEKAAADAAAAVIEAAKTTTAPPVAAAPAPQPQATAAPAADNGKTMKLGDINSLFGFAVTADFLATLGFQPARVEKGAKLYRDCDFPAICTAIAGRLQALARDHAMEAAAH